MVFNSIEFLIFLPIVFAIYWALQKRLKLQNIFVVVASYVFYGWWDWRFLILIALTSFFSWGSGLLIDEAKEDNKKSKLWLAANIAVNLLILGVFKYFNFFVGSFCDLFGLGNSIAIKVILPVGISFYTFQALSYSIDVYRRKIEPTRDVIAFFAYVSFFPQLVAGPIERATNLLPQFLKSRTFDYNEAVIGMRRILWGLFKKIVVADNCATYVDAVWKDMASQNASTLILAAVLFALQIYGDFSGYSDIAIGTAKLFGINLKNNFLTPYFSRNVAEFWKRWHISLNTWFVDYVYIPLGGSREGRWKTIRNTFVIFLLSGLWHGANWTYVGWGLYHALLFIPLIMLGLTKKHMDTPTWKQLPAIILTFILTTIGWVIFRAPSISEAGIYLSSIFSSSLLTIPWLMNKTFYIPLFISIAIMTLGDWVGRKEGWGLSWLTGKPTYVRWGIYYALIVMMFFWQSSEDIQFIYFQF